MRPKANKQLGENLQMQLDMWSIAMISIFPRKAAAVLTTVCQLTPSFPEKPPSPSLIILFPHHLERIVLGGNLMQSVGQGPRIMASDFLYGPSHWLNHQILFAVSQFNIRTNWKFAPKVVGLLLENQRANHCQHVCGEHYLPV